MGKEINTIYIISKGRPQCKTAETLTRLKFPGKWFIVCGNNDETLEEYKRRWGDKVIVFDWFDEVKKTDFLDNFGYEKMASGACPVRNAVIKLSTAKGEARHWQFDDDYPGFAIYVHSLKKNRIIKDGNVLFNAMHKIAQFGDKANLPNVGFCLTAICLPQNAFCYQHRVFNAHNISNTNPQIWRGRLNDDTINAIEIMRKGRISFSFNFLSMNSPQTQKESGGLTKLYREQGTARKSAYVILLNPLSGRIVIKFGRYHHKVGWAKITSKIIREKWRGNE